MPAERRDGTALAPPAADRRALRAIGVQFFVNGAVAASYIPRLPEIRTEIDADLTTVGQILALSTLGGVLGSVFVGRATTKLGTKRTMLGGAVFVVMLLPLVALVAEPWHLLLVLFAIHAGDVLTDVAMNMQGSRLSARRAVPVMNRLHGMWSLGTVVGGLIAVAMVELDVGLGVHLVGAAVVLVAALLYVMPGLLPTDPPPDPARDRSRRAAGKVVVAFGALGAAAILPEMINSDWAAFRMTDDLGTTESVAGLAYVAFTAGMVSGRFSGDSVAARVGSTNLLRAATVTAIAGTALATLLSSNWSVFIGLFVAGSGVSVMFPQLYDRAAHSPNPGAALGALTAGIRVSLLAVPALVGALADTDSFTVGEAIAFVVIPASLAVLLLTPNAAANPR